MPASKPSTEAGRFLKALRLRLRLSAREVERLSRRFAQEKKSQDYYVSHTWLSDIENAKFTPSIYKLYSLSVIYKCAYSELLECLGIDLGNIGQEQARLTLPLTHLIGGHKSDFSGTVEIPPELKGTARFEKTNLVSHMFHQWGGIPVSLLPRLDSHNSVYGYVGTQDFTLFPWIRPGSFVEIDAGQRRIERILWSSEVDRPIFFVELRDSYACSWCELRERRLFLVPSSQSRCQIREVRFPDDAEIIGRVTAVSMRISEK